jgi:exonuclease SbcC
MSQSELDEFCEAMISHVDTLSNNSDVIHAVKTTLFGGENTFVSKQLQESKIFDESWVTTIETLIPSIDAIIRNPKSSIRIEQDIVPVERAKGFSANSVRHLASHTENVREIKDDGRVIPSKVLVEYREEDLEIYENRFLKTLINRLFYFLNRRYEAIKDQYESFTRNTLECSNHFKTLTSDVNCKMTLDIKNVFGSEELNEKNHALIGRIEKLLLLVKGFRASKFIAEGLKRAKEVVPPIMKTNIITHNIHFKNCYLLWQFIERYTSLGFDVQNKEQPMPVESFYQVKLLDTAMLFYLFNEQHDSKLEGAFDDEIAREKLLKRGKVLKNGDINFELKPTEIPLEYNGITDEFLRASKKLFNGPYEDLVTQGIEPSLALRKVIKQMLTIVNAVYKAMFAIPQTDTDFYAQLTDNGPDDAEEIARYKKQISIMKTVISVKKQDVASSEAELARYEKYLARHQASLLKKQKRQEAEKKRQERLKLTHELDDLKNRDLALLPVEKQNAIKSRIKELRMLLMTKEQRQKEEERDALRQKKLLEAKKKQKEAQDRAAAKQEYNDLLNQSTEGLTDDEIKARKEKLEQLKLASMTKEQKDAYLARQKAKEQERLAKIKEREAARDAALAEKEKAKEMAKKKREAELAKAKAIREAELARIKAEKEAERLKAQEEAKKAREAELARIKKEKEEECARIKAEKEAERLKAQEEAKKAHEAELARIKEEQEKQEAARKKAEEEAKKAREAELARIKEEQERQEAARKKAEQEAQEKRELEKINKEIAEAEEKYGPNSLEVLAKKYIRNANRLYQQAEERKKALENKKENE